MKHYLVLIVMLMVLIPNYVNAEKYDITIHDFKNAYVKGEIMEFYLELPGFCGENKFSVEDVSFGDKIWNRILQRNCNSDDEFSNRMFTQHFTTAPPLPGGTEITVDPVITSYEGTFHFVYEVNDMRKEWQYQVFEKIPLHLDSNAHLRLTLLAAFYAILPLILYKEEIRRKLKK
ncbi:hypothetical protein DSQ20_04665 [Nitrosarchaeum sp. AC2]|nr:hypothetical protein DSQ20_04665 [Nitrosarchaeum sp. AC2]